MADLEYTILLGEDRSFPLRMHRPIDPRSMPKPGQTLVIGSRVYEVDRIIEDFRKVYPNTVIAGLVNPVVVAYRK